MIRSRFNVLPGDADRSGAVPANDFCEVNKKFFAIAAYPGAGPPATQLSKRPPGRSPSPTIPPPLVQRKAS